MIKIGYQYSVGKVIEDISEMADDLFDEIGSVHCFVLLFFFVLCFRLFVITPIPHWTE